MTSLPWRRSSSLLAGIALLLVAGPSVAGAQSDTGRAAPRDPSADRSAEPDATGMAVSFLHDVIPALTRAGCNGGGCHGSPSGKNGFRLSLRGYEPEADYVRLTRGAQGRRLNRVNPDASLFLLKATGQIPHEGGRRFGRDDRLYRILRDWVAQGARDDTRRAPRVEHLQIVPASSLLEGPAAEQPLRVVAHYADGSARDVSGLTRWSVNDESVARVDTDGRVHRLRKGEVVAAAEYLGVMAAATIAFLDAGRPASRPMPQPANYIDQHVFAKLRRLRIEPSPGAGDAEFLRRAFLDVTGQLPTPDEVRQFLADRTPDKRARLIDDLLERPEFADWWAMKWADRLGCNRRFVGRVGAFKYHEWIRQAMEDNVPEDEFVRAVLTGRGGNYEHPPASFYRRVRDPGTTAEEVAELFLGVRLQCARCHNHPGERWTQDDYYGLAAFFARVRYKDGPSFEGIYDKEETVYIDRKGEVANPRTGRRAQPRYLGGPTAEIAPGEDRREVLARWLTQEDNPFFARASANRIWYHLTGRGIVEPVDDVRSTNPASNEPLLAALADDLVKHHFDRKHLIRTIMRSRTYQLSSRPTPTNADDEKNFSHARVRLLPAEALLNAVCAATGQPEKFPGLPVGITAICLPDGEYRHPFLEIFGRPARASACECERSTDTTLNQALELVGGRLVQQKLHAPGGRVSRLLSAGQSDAALLEELFLATLSRYPTSAERRLLLERLHRAPDRRRAAEDILWALINHAEFLFQH